MEIIGYGILLAIGFYIAPLVLALIGIAVAFVVGAISALFSKDNK